MQSVRKRRVSPDVPRANPEMIASETDLELQDSVVVVDTGERGTHRSTLGEERRASDGSCKIYSSRFNLFLLSSLEHIF